MVAHNTAFDVSVLRWSAWYRDYAPPPFEFACTYRLARAELPEAESWRLDSLAADLGIALRYHDPVSDAQAAGLLLVHLAKRTETFGNLLVSCRVNSPRFVVGLWGLSRCVGRFCDGCSEGA